MNSVLITIILSAKCFADSYLYGVYYEYMFPPPTSGVQPFTIDRDDSYLLYSGRQSSSEYMIGLNRYIFDDNSSTYHTEKFISLNSPEPRSHYGLFDANQKWMYLFGGMRVLGC